MIFVAIGGVLLYILLHDTPKEDQKEVQTSGRQIKEVLPSVSTNATSKSAEAKDPHEGYVLSSTGVWQPANHPYRAGWKKVHGIVTNRMHRSSAAHSSTDQILLSIFTRSPGDMPMPLPARLSPKDVSKMTEILLDKHPDKEGSDSELDKANKELLRQVKKEALKFIKDGGTMEEFIRHYHKELTSAYQERTMAQRYVAKIYREGEDSELVSEMVQTINKKLQDRGIKTIRNPVVKKEEK